MSHQVGLQQQNISFNVQLDDSLYPYSSDITTTISEINNIVSTIKNKKEYIGKRQNMLAAEQVKLAADQANLMKMMKEFIPMTLLGMKLTFYELAKLLWLSELALNSHLTLTPEMKLEDLIKLSEMMMNITNENLTEYRKWIELITTAKKILAECM